MTTRHGGCACGAIRYTIHKEVSETGACHCETCRKWSGGVFMGVEVPSDGITFSGEKAHVWTSSDWAERGFCGACGSALYYRITMPGPHQGVYHMGFGGLDDTQGVALTGELFVDQRPEAIVFEGGDKRTALTGAELFAMFGGDG